MKKSVLPLTAGLLLLASCSTPKNITYFQDLTNGETIQPQKVYDIRVRPEDKLSIIVTTQDQQLSSLFNLVQAQTRLTAAGTASGAANSSDGKTAYYTVSPSGDINFPVLGKLHIAGMTRSELAEFIEKKLIENDLVKQPVVTVEFINTGISVLGEVARPGKYEFNEDHITLLEALAIAGDLKPNGQRENVIVLRANNGKQETYVVDLTNAKNLTASPAYYLQPDDVIYVEPNDRSKRETTSAGNTPFTPSFWLSVGSIGLTVATLIVTLTK
jgi:polysaccharide export outer membrane protein